MYEEQKPGLGREFLDAVDATLEKAESNSLRYSRVYKDVRRASAGKFPFGIFCIDENELISVLRVLHEARNPARWQRRD